jgi:hypothetical protein
MNTAFVIAAAVMAGVLVFLFSLKLLLAAVHRKMAAEVARRLPGVTPLRQELTANFFGQTSKGLAQIRGNGALVLTHDELWFLRLAPRTEYRVPLDRVTAVSLPMSHLGKSIMRKLLRVEFRSEAGEAGEDSIAWAVRDPDGWKGAIEKAMGERG